MLWYKVAVVVRGRLMRLGLDAELEHAAAFRTALRRLLARTDAVANRAGLTSQRYDLLLQIRSAGKDGVRVTELCQRLQLRQTAVTELVKRAEEAGLVQRRRSATDGRVSLLRLTAEGERVRERGHASDDGTALVPPTRSSWDQEPSTAPPTTHDVHGGRHSCRAAPTPRTRPAATATGDG